MSVLEIIVLLEFPIKRTAEKYIIASVYVLYNRLYRLYCVYCVGSFMHYLLQLFSLRNTPCISSSECMSRCFCLVLFWSNDNGLVQIRRYQYLSRLIMSAEHFFLLLSRPLSHSHCIPYLVSRRQDIFL